MRFPLTLIATLAVIILLVQCAGPEFLGTKPVVFTRTYDIENLRINVSDRRAPRFDERGVAPTDGIPPWYRNDGPVITYHECLGDEVMCRVAPASWAMEFGTGMVDDGEHLEVTQTPLRHILVANYLANMREKQDRRVETHVRFVRLPSGAPSAPAGKALPPGAEELSTVTVECLRGWWDYEIDEGPDADPWRIRDDDEELRGTVVEVRPDVEDDGGTAVLQLHLARYADEDPIEWRAETTVRCKDGGTVVVKGEPGCDGRIVAYVRVRIVRPFGN